MVNATAITVTSLAVQGTATLVRDTFNAGTDPITVSADVDGATDRIFLLIQNQITNTLTVSIAAGDNPPAILAGQGALEKTGIQTTNVLIGPLQSQRFLQSDGTISVTLTPSPAATVSCYVSCFKLGKI